ncbi:MAG: hypothetical protein ACWA5R_10325 [bacterium]
MTQIKEQENSLNLQEITDKRHALERLIKIAISIQNQQQSFEDLSIIALPSQTIPQGIIDSIVEPSEELLSLDSSELQLRLEKLEEVTLITLNKVLALADLNPDELSHDELKNISIEGFLELTEDFEKRVRSALSLRHLLKQKQIHVAPFKLPVSQESVKDKIDQLKADEKKCVDRIKNEIADVIADTSKLLKYPDLSKEMRNELESVKQAMQVNLNHLELGGDVRTIPNVFEIITLETPGFEEQKESELKNRKEQEKQEIKKTREVLAKKIEQESLTKKKQGFWAHLKAWLFSPKDVKWKELDK